MKTQFYSHALACLGCLVIGGSLARAQDEVVVRLQANHASAEHSAALVHGWGKVLGHVGPGEFLIQLLKDVTVAQAAQRLLSRTGVLAVRPSWRPGVASLDGDVATIGAMITSMLADAKARGLDGEESGVDYFEAYYDYVALRAYPFKQIDWSAYGRAAEHREQMPSVPLSSTLDAHFGWEFMGPTNLDIPYKTYYGTRPINGRVNGLAWDPVDPSTYYLAAAGGGVWKTTSAGATWVALSDDWPTIHANCVAVHPANRNIVFAGSGDFHGSIGYSLGLMKSVDGGSTWAVKGAALFGGKSISKITIDPETPSRMFVTTGRGSSGGNGHVWRSTDSGETWTQAMATSVVWWGTAYGALNSGVGSRWLYAAGGGTDGNVWRSGDRGQTWTRLTPPISTGSHTRLEIAASPLFPDTVYLLVPRDQKIYKSTNAGGVWTDISTGFIHGHPTNTTYNWSQSTYDAFIAVSSKNATDDVVYVGLIDVAQSFDGGATWRSIGGPTWVSSAIVHNDHQAVAVSPHDPNVVLFGSDGGAYRVTYTPATNAFAWDFLSRNLGISQFYKSNHHPTNPDIAIGGTQDNATPVVSGDLLNWRNKGGGDGGFAAINFNNPNIQYATSQNLGVYRTVNNWSSSNGISPSTGSDLKLFISPIVISKADPNFLYAGTNYLWMWTESTQSWTARLGGQKLSVSSAIRAIGTTQADVNRIYTGASAGELWMTTDKGATWTQINTGITSLPNRTISAIAVHPTNPNDLLVTVTSTGTGHLWRCTNPTAGGARTWTDVSGSGPSGLPNISATAVARDLDDPTNAWFVGTDVGAFLSTNAGATWLNLTQPFGLPNVQVNDLHSIAGTRMLNAATYGRGMWRLDLPTDTAALAGVLVDPNAILGGGSTIGTVTLGGSAAVRGSTVLLSSSSVLAAVPGSVVVPFGSNTQSFAIPTQAVGFPTPVTISATRLGSTLQAALTLTPEPDIVVPSSWSVGPGLHLSGGLAELYNSDDQRLLASLDLATERVGFPVTLNLAGTSPTASPTTLRFVLESNVQIAGLRQTIQLFDWTANQFVTVDVRSAPTSETTVTATAAGSLSRFVRPGTREIRARIGWESVAADFASAWRVWIDRAWWRIQ